MWKAEVDQCHWRISRSSKYDSSILRFGFYPFTSPYLARRCFKVFVTQIISLSSEEQPSGQPDSFQHPLLSLHPYPSYCPNIQMQCVSSSTFLFFRQMYYIYLYWICWGLISWNAMRFLYVEYRIIHSKHPLINTHPIQGPNLSFWCTNTLNTPPPWLSVDFAQK